MDLKNSEKSSNIDLFQEIKKLKKDLNATILSHFYQDEDIQDIADFVGDSLDLSRKAASTESDVIVFCGVKFMAEVAKILSPKKTVLVPDYSAGCSLEDSCKPAEFAKFKEQYPNALTLTYINCSAEIKALSDIIVTSSNAKKIIDQIPLEKDIIFAPDKHLGKYLSKISGRNMILWNGSCIVHEQFSEKELVKLSVNHPKALIIAHPECPESLLEYADHIGSTSSLLNFVSQNQNQEFIVLTEPHIIHQMKKINSSSKFYECNFIDKAGCSICNSCPYMGMNNIEKLYKVMYDFKNNIKQEKSYGGQINLDEFISLKAKKSLDKMLKMSV